MGEAWHNNHHAFPESARLGLERGQNDAGWWMLCVLRKLGLVWNIQLPEDLPVRPELRRSLKADNHATGGTETEPAKPAFIRDQPMCS